jgi:hypothetical protein
VRRLLLPVLVLAALAVPAVASASYLTNGRVTLTYLGGHFGRITDLVSPPGSPGKLWVVDQDGLVTQLANGKRTTILDLRHKIAYRYTASATDERGLLSIAFPPGYRRSHVYYVYYTAVRPGDRLGSILTVARVARRHLTTVVDFQHANLDNHNGGDLHFGPGGQLFLTTGDGSGVNDSNTTSQDPTSPLGKLIRIDPQTGAATILDIGLRNPFRFSFDPPTHSIYIADVGEARWESIYREPETSSGLNFGWPMCEGAHVFNPANLLAPTGLCDAPGVTPPTFEYSHAHGCAVIGGYVERDPRFADSTDDLDGKYVFGDLCTGQLWAMSPSGHAKVVKGLGVNDLTTFGEDSRGRLYMGSLLGKVFRIDPVPSGKR